MTDEEREDLLNDPTLTNTERRLIEENPTADPYELLEAHAEYELT